MTRHFYFHRIVRLWNSLPQLDLSLSLETLKKKLYDHFWAHFITNFDSSNNFIMFISHSMSLFCVCLCKPKYNF